MNLHGKHNHLERFLSYFEVTETCWPWSKHRDKDGYGRFNSKMLCPYTGYSASRLMWELVHNKLVPKGMNICHTCDNPPCVNPEHLFLGSVKKNSDDKYARNRMELLFTDKDVARIKEVYKNTPLVRFRKRSYAVPLAEEYGVTKQQIDIIARGKYNSGGMRTRRHI